MERSRLGITTRQGIAGPDAGGEITARRTVGPPRHNAARGKMVKPPIALREHPRLFIGLPAAVAAIDCGWHGFLIAIGVDNCCCADDTRRLEKVCSGDHWWCSVFDPEMVGVHFGV